MEKWPNFFIVGTAKAGTTSLHEYLNKIPGIFMSPIKEPHYFSRSDIPNDNQLLDPIKDKIKYLSLFNEVKNEKIIGESSASYLTSIEAPSLIHTQIPNARILISLRDPIERAISAYLDHRRYGRITKTLDQQIKIQLKGISEKQSYLPLQNGLYFDNVKRYLEIFGSDHVKIIIFEEWIKDIKTTIQEILEFLGIEFVVTAFEEEIHNPSTAPRGLVAQRILGSKITSKISNRILSSSSKRFFSNFLLKKNSKPKMSEESIHSLKIFYNDDVEKLKNLLGRDLPWPNFQF